MQFEYNGKVYEVSAMTEFQSDMRNYYLIQLGTLVQRRLDLPSFDAIPPSLDKICSLFIDWHLTTKIDGKGFELITLTSLDPVLAFAASLEDDALYKAWNEAFQVANKAKRDETTEKNAPAPEAV